MNGLLVVQGIEKSLHNSTFMVKIQARQAILKNYIRFNVAESMTEKYLKSRMYQRFSAKVQQKMLLTYLPTTIVFVTFIRLQLCYQ